MVRRKFGFTLIEVMGAIVIGVIATGAITWSIMGIQNISRVHLACTQAAAINTAKVMYWHFAGEAGLASYNGVADEAKFNLVKRFIPYTGPDIQLKDYLCCGFSVNMNALNEKVTLKQNGKTIEY